MKNAKSGVSHPPRIMFSNILRTVCSDFGDERFRKRYVIRELDRVFDGDFGGVVQSPEKYRNCRNCCSVFLEALQYEL